MFSSLDTGRLERQLLLAPGHGPLPGKRRMAQVRMALGGQGEGETSCRRHAPQEAVCQ